MPQTVQIRTDIEKEIGAELVWDPHPEKRDKTIVMYRHANLESRKDWPVHLDRMADMIRRFRNAFMGRMRTLDLSADSGGEN